MCLGTAVLFRGLTGFCRGRSLGGEPLVLGSCRLPASAEFLGPHGLHLHPLCNGHKAKYLFSFENEQFGPTAPETK